MEDWVGFRLCPTEDETVGCHLYYRLMKKELLANEFINEINIYKSDPWELRLKSKFKSRDSVWYFFVPVENNYANGDRQKRTTNSGFWKITGDPLPIFDRWGRWSGNRGPIGYKRVLRFHKGKTPNVGKADWVMHEYHNTMVESDLRTHVICRVEYKGDNTSFISDNATEPCPAFMHHLTNGAGSVVDQLVPGNWGSTNTLTEYDPIVQMGQLVQGNCVPSGHVSEYNPTNQMQDFSGNFNTQEQVHFTSNDNEIPMLPDKDLKENFEIPMLPDKDLKEFFEIPMLTDKELEEMFDYLDNNGEPNSCTYMQVDSNEYRPKDPVTRVFDDYTSDSDNESTLFGDTSSSEDSVGNSNELISAPIPPLNSMETEEAKLELQGKEKVMNELECKMAEDSCINKTAAKVRSKQRWVVVEDDEKIEKKSHKTPKSIYLRTKTITIALFLLFSIIVFGHYLCD